MAIQRKQAKEVDLNLVLKTINTRFDKIGDRLNVLEDGAKKSIEFQDGQIQHYKIRLKNQEDIKDSLKAITNALVETPLNDGGLVKKQKLQGMAIKKHSEMLSNHKAFFVIIGSAIMLIGGTYLSNLYNSSKQSESNKSITYNSKSK